MAIIQTVSASDFHDAFHNMGRGDQFTYDARCALYDYLDELSEDTGKDMVLDVIAICCDFVECESIAEFAEQYLDVNEQLELGELDGDEALDWVENHLSDNSNVIHVKHDSILFWAF